MHIYVYVYICIYTHIYILTYVCMCIYIHWYIYMCIHLQGLGLVRAKANVAPPAAPAPCPGGGAPSQGA